MTTTPPLKVGQTLYRVVRRRNGNPTREIEEVTVKTVGTKYFTLEQEADERYVRATLAHECFTSERLHLTSQEITDEWARASLQHKLCQLFDYKVLAFDKLRQVEAIFSTDL